MTVPKTRSRTLWIVLAVLAAGAAITVLVRVQQAHGRQREAAHLLEEARGLRDLKNDPSAALVKLKEARRLVPEDPEVLLEQGITCYQLDQLKDAEEHLDQAYLHAGGDLLPRISLAQGLVYRRQWAATGEKGRFQRAVAAFEGARDSAALCPEALYHLAFLVLRLERNKELGPESEIRRAKSYLQELVTDYPDSEYVERAKTLLGLVAAVADQGG